jgi:hypothetical protein
MSVNRARPTHRARAARFICAALLGGMTPRSASADPAPTRDLARAERLFREGRTLITRGDYVQACPKFAESFRLDPAAGTLLALALCHEQEGRTATALREFVELRERATREHRADRADFAREHVVALETKVAKLTLQVAVDPSLSRDLVVKRNGEPVDASSWNVAVPIDPGTVRIEANAPGLKPLVLTYDLASGERKELVVGPFERDAPPQAAAPAPPAHGPSTRLVAGYTTGAAGIVGIGVGTFFGISALTTMAEVRGPCPPPGPCSDASLASESHKALDSANIANVAIGAGLVALAVGAYLVFVRPADAHPAKAGLTLTPGGLAWRAGAL